MHTVFQTFTKHMQREQLAGDIGDANESLAILYPDVSAWPIIPHNITQQEDG